MTVKDLIEFGAVLVHPQGEGQPEYLPLKNLVDYIKEQVKQAEESGPDPDPKGSPTAQEMIKLLGKGVNLAALEAPNEGDWGVTLEADDFVKAKQAGFQHIRLPVRWDNKLQNGTIRADWMKRVTWCLDQAKANGLRVMLNVHHYGGLMADPVGQRPVFVSIWTQIAEAFKNRPDGELCFEILNEPNNKAQGEALNTLMADGLAAIRKSNPTRVVVIGHWTNNGLHIAPAFRAPSDNRLILECHCYTDDAGWGGHWTHQGFNNENKNQPWTTKEAGKKFIIDNMNAVDNWARTRNIPVHLGEFGTTVHCPQNDRMEYLSFVRSEAEKRGWSWAVWVDRSDVFGLRTKNQAFPPHVRQALGLT
jgi:endoglucanase